MKEVTSRGALGPVTCPRCEQEASGDLLENGTCSTCWDELFYDCIVCSQTSEIPGENVTPDDIRNLAHNEDLCVPCYREYGEDNADTGDKKSHLLDDF